MQNAIVRIVVGTATGDPEGGRGSDPVLLRELDVLENVVKDFALLTAPGNSVGRR